MRVQLIRIDGRRDEVRLEARERRGHGGERRGAGCGYCEYGGHGLCPVPVNGPLPKGISSGMSGLSVMAGAADAVVVVPSVAGLARSRSGIARDALEKFAMDSRSLFCPRASPPALDSAD